MAVILLSRVTQVLRATLLSQVNRLDQLSIRIKVSHLCRQLPTLQLKPSRSVKIFSVKIVASEEAAIFYGQAQPFQSMSTGLERILSGIGVWYNAKYEIIEHSTRGKLV